MIFEECFKEVPRLKKRVFQGFLKKVIVMFPWYLRQALWVKGGTNELGNFQKGKYRAQTNILQSKTMPLV